jgi:hypothetical protein
MKIGLAAGIISVLLLGGCCLGLCAPCKERLADDQVVFEFDTSSVSGFPWNELDTIDIYRFDDKKTTVDTLHYGFSGKSFYNRTENSLDAGDLDNFHFGKRKALFYELRIKGHPKVYYIRDFELKIILNDTKKCCDCDGSKVKSVIINDTLLTMEQLPFRISKK